MNPVTRGRFSCHTDATSTQIAAYTTTVGSESVTYSYTYDGNGNILTVTSGGKTTSYEYDSANQLIRENNEAADYTHTWTYDNAGNLLQRKEYDYTDGSLTNVTAADSVSYGYPAVTDPENNTVWGDKLTSYDDKAITYDQIGNPLSFGNRTYSWEHGRQLKSLTEGDTTWNYTYNSGGMRTGRTDGTTTYQYIYSGSQLAQMKVGSNTLNFTYDAAGVPLTVTYNGTKYYYTTNIQGDVVAILDSSGTQVASYTYDAWGNCLTAPTSGVGLHNPLRYRGYVYDRETQLYYLQSRYYDPKVGRFLNADGYTTTGQGLLGNNMFAYCGNSPIANCDPSGNYYACAENRITDGTTTYGYPPPKLHYIDSQLDKDIGSLKVGDKTVEESGCAVVASYNACRTLDRYIPFQCVLDYYNRDRDRHIGDTGGIYVSSVIEYFEALGYTVFVYNNYFWIDMVSQYADACILFYRWDPDPEKAGHAVSYRKLVYNYMFINVDGPVADFCKSPSVFLEEQGAISATAILIFKE